MIGHWTVTRVPLLRCVPYCMSPPMNLVRAVIERAGIHDVLAKVQGSRNPLNVVKATLDGLLQLRSLKEAAEMREIPLNKLWEA